MAALAKAAKVTAKAFPCHELWFEPHLCNRPALTLVSHSVSDP